jgi:16S rRNA G966 N2-methylase RsmD
MTEKRNQSNLIEYLNKYFNNQHIYYSISEEPTNTLKRVFLGASKTNKRVRYGIPDGVIFDKNKKTLVIIECKSTSIRDALKDLRHYGDYLKADENVETIFFVAYINDSCYKIYNSNFEVLNRTLKPQSFNLNDSIVYNKSDMNKDIEEIHNYIRNNTKISNEDKSFFIAIILVSLQKETFIHLIENYDKNYTNKKYIYDLLEINLREFDIDISVFEFLRNDSNNVYFYELVKKILNIYKKNPTIDLLNTFYCEFIKYNNTDSKSLGIVLTPHHIIKLMIQLLELQKNDTFLDLCGGTGSFGCEAYKYDSKILMCEYQTKLFNLLKCNMIIRTIPKSLYTIYKGDCFSHQFRATKSAINPPYGNKQTPELLFVLKQLESLEEGGLCCSIIPISNIRKSSLRNQITNMARVRRIIICNEKLFYNSNAGVKVVILLLQKICGGHQPDDKVLFSNYEDDGFYMKRTQGRVEGPDYLEKYNQVLYNATEITIDVNDDEWFNEKIDSNISRKHLQNTLYTLNYLDIALDSTTPAEYITYPTREFCISELFDIQKKPSIPYTKHKNVFVISAKNNNNGVKGVEQSDTNTFTGNKIVIVTGGDGGAGLAYYQRQDFKITSATIVLSPKSTIHLDDRIGIFVANVLSKYKKKYCRGYQWSLSRIQNDTIDLPIDDTGNIDYDYIYSLF